MGCTSSAPNMGELQPDSTDDLGNTFITNNSKDSAELRKTASTYENEDCEQGQVLSENEIINKQEQVDIDNNTPGQGNPKTDTTGNQDTGSNKSESKTVCDTVSISGEENFSNLKDVVEKIILGSADEDETNSLQYSQKADVDRQIEQIPDIESNGINDDNVVQTIIGDTSKESTSPTQSEDSRATRWEALADIAAELPPSLAVDPITGQIYSLTK